VLRTRASFARRQGSIGRHIPVTHAEQASAKLLRTVGRFSRIESDRISRRVFDGSGGQICVSSLPKRFCHTVHEGLSGAFPPVTYGRAYAVRPATTTFPDQAFWCARCSAMRSAPARRVVGSLLGGVREPVLHHAFEYWKSIDGDVGRGIKDKVRSSAVKSRSRGTGEG